MRLDVDGDDRGGVDGRRRPGLLQQPEQSDGHRPRREDRRPTWWSASARRRPHTVILIDEAYHDYVTDPSYETAMPLALSTPNVFVARTFSKAYGMAGMRIGYAIGMPDDGEEARPAQDAA